MSMDRLITDLSVATERMISYHRVGVIGNTMTFDSSFMNGHIWLKALLWVPKPFYAIITLLVSEDYKSKKGAITACPVKDVGRLFQRWYLEKILLSHIMGIFLIIATVSILRIQPTSLIPCCPTCKYDSVNCSTTFYMNKRSFVVDLTTNVTVMSSGSILGFSGLTWWVRAVWEKLTLCFSDYEYNHFCLAILTVKLEYRNDMD